MTLGVRPTLPTGYLSLVFTHVPRTSHSPVGQCDTAFSQNQVKISYKATTAQNKAACNQEDSKRLTATASPRSHCTYRQSLSEYGRGSHRFLYFLLIKHIDMEEPQLWCCYLRIRVSLLLLSWCKRGLSTLSRLFKFTSILHSHSVWGKSVYNRSLKENIDSTIHFYPIIPS